TSTCCSSRIRRSRPRLNGPPTWPCGPAMRTPLGRRYTCRWPGRARTANKVRKYAGSRTEIPRPGAGRWTRVGVGRVRLRHAGAVSVSGYPPSHRGVEKGYNRDLSRFLAEPSAAADRRGMTAFREVQLTRPRRLL